MTKLQHPLGNRNRFLPKFVCKFGITFLLLMLSATAFAQQTTISGKILDERTKEPILGANIRIKGANNGTSTDQAGSFNLKVKDLPITLLISSVDYKNQEIDVYEAAPTTIYLSEDLNRLNSVVVIGYGTQKKNDLTGSVSIVDTKFIENKPFTNASQALQGVNGLYVNQVGGQPGNDVATIRIRGVGTLNDNNPLVLVNGIEYNLKDINPEDIESITVLKDATASIYGNRAANGVILVTTKKGKKGKAQLEYKSSVGWEKATYLPDVVTNSADWMTARNLTSTNEGQPLVFTAADIEAFRTSANTDLYPNTDWYDIMFRTAKVQNHNVRVSGGDDKTKYSISANYLNQEGGLIATDAQKYSLNTNIFTDVSKKLKVGAELSATYWDRHEPAEGANSTVGSISRALPIDPNILTTGQYGDTRYITPGHNVFRHPYAKAVEGGLDTKSLRILANITAEYTLPFDIHYKINLAANKYDEGASKFVPEIYLYDPANMANPKILRYDPSARSSTRYNKNNLNTSFFQTLSWNKKIQDSNDVGLLLGFSQESFDASNFYAYVEGFLGNDLTELNSGTINKDVGGTSSTSKLMSYFGRANYSYKDRYLLELNFRYDGSSRFSQGNRWGFFPSVSGAWKINEEPFLKNIALLKNLKLRASLGKLGNQNIALYSYSNTINLSQGYSFNKTVVSGAAVTTLSDNNITWEKSTIGNIGLDLGLWDNKFQFVADIFNKKTTDILARINVPSQVGDLTGPITNLYDMSNKGLELSASYSNSINKLNYNFGAGIAFVKNNVDFLNGDVQYSGDGNLYITKEGYPVNSYFLYVSEGLFNTQDEIDNHAFQNAKTAPGDIIYKDLNDDDVIDSKDRLVTGRTIPKYTYTFNGGLSYKGFDLNVLFQGVEGVDLYPKGNLAFGNFNGAGLTKDMLANSWTAENTDAKYPRLGEPKRGSGINYVNSTFWLQDGSYLRLKNVQVGYTFKSKVLDKIKITKLKIFANVQNLLTFSDYKLTDPERGVMQTDISEYPSVKTVTLGLNIVY